MGYCVYLGVTYKLEYVMTDTLYLIKDNIKLELISEFTKNDTLLIKQIAGHSENVIKDFVPIITSAIGIIGIMIGYFFNKFENKSNINREKIKFFKNQTLQYKKAKITYDDLMLSYYDLPKSIKKRNLIDNIKDVKPDNLDKFCHEVLKGL